MADELFAKVVPGLIVQGEPGAERNRDQVYTATQAVTFDNTGDLYRVDNLASVTLPASFPATIGLPDRMPELNQGQGPWFTAGEKLVVECRMRLDAQNTNAAAAIWLGPVWGSTVETGTTTVADAAVIMGGVNYSLVQIGMFGPPAQEPATGALITARWEIQSHGPQLQSATVDYDIYQINNNNVGEQLPERAGYPRMVAFTEDFSGSDSQQLYFMANVVTADTGDLSSIDLRLLSVNAWLYGAPGVNE